MELRLLQWNVLYTESAENILKLVSTINADIICLQELTQDSRANPRINIPGRIEQLGYDSHYFITLTKDNFIMGNGIFSKCPISTRSSIYTHRGGKSPNYSSSYADEPRAYIEATADVLGRKLHIGTTHLSYVDMFKPTPERDKENEKFLSYVREHQQDFIFTGDFNATPESALVRTLAAEFQHASPDFTEKTWTTKPFSYNGFEANALDWRLDYVFCTQDITVVSRKIVQTQYSDHLPILVTIKI
jgi:endonuclease/exonuclease/phosphatase family metal-dependent hydrolase